MSDNPFDLLRLACIQAKETFRAADNQADQMARLLVGRLRNVSTHTLSQLKRELRDFNIDTGRWRS